MDGVTVIDDGAVIVGIGPQPSISIPSPFTKVNPPFVVVSVTVVPLHLAQVPAGVPPENARTPYVADKASTNGSGPLNRLFDGYVLSVDKVFCGTQRAGGELLQTYTMPPFTTTSAAVVAVPLWHVDGSEVMDRARVAVPPCAKACAVGARIRIVQRI